MIDALSLGDFPDVAGREHLINDHIDELIGQLQPTDLPKIPLSRITAGGTNETFTPRMTRH